MAKIIMDINSSSLVSVRNMQKVYVCIHPADEGAYFESIKSDLLGINPDLSIWHYAFDDTPEEVQLAEMDLFITIVTNKFLVDLSKGQFSCYKALNLAKELHLPVLPIIQDGVSRESYKEVFQTEQSISKISQKKNDIPYLERLKMVLDRFLLNNSEIEEIRRELPASIFLSYRKVDRQYIKTIMETIHADDRLQAVGIWYDEYLTPGEKYDEEIGKAINDCDIVLLMGTPNVIKKPNYVMDVEYPRALELKKKIVPVRLTKMKKRALEDHYSDTEEVIDIEDIDRLNNLIYELLKDKLDTLTLDDAKHTYLLGLAYHRGILVEKNEDKAIGLLKHAIALGSDKAYEVLSEIYHNITDRNYFEEEIIVRKQYLEKLSLIVKDEKDKSKIYEQTMEIARCVLGRVRFDEAKEWYKSAERILCDLSNRESIDDSMSEYELYSEIGDSIRMKASDKKEILTVEEIKEAQEYYSKALKIAEEEQDVFKQARQYGNIGGLYYQIAELIILIAEQKNDPSEMENAKKEIEDYINEAIKYCFKARDLIKAEEEDIDHHNMKQVLSIIDDKIYGIYNLIDEYENALEYAIESYNIWQTFSNENSNRYHLTGYAVALFNYGHALYNLNKKQEAKTKLTNANNIINDMKSSPRGMSYLAITIGVKINYLLSRIYADELDYKKAENCERACQKYENELRRIG